MIIDIIKKASVSTFVPGLILYSTGISGGLILLYLGFLMTLIWIGDDLVRGIKLKKKGLDLYSELNDAIVSIGIEFMVTFIVNLLIVLNGQGLTTNQMLLVGFFYAFGTIFLMIGLFLKFYRNTS